LSRFEAFILYHSFFFPLTLAVFEVSGRLAETGGGNKSPLAAFESAHLEQLGLSSLPTVLTVIGTLNPGLSAVRCAKTAEPIDLPFALSTRVGRRMHKFNRIRQVAPICPTILFRDLCQNGWTGRFAVWAVESGWAEGSTSSIVFAR